ncbi:hypothetical protein [Leptospira stimsonii]|nr:hypothetical protein [Leptospira stimsonii]
MSDSKPLHSKSISKNFLKSLKHHSKQNKAKPKAAKQSVGFLRSKDERQQTASQQIYLEELPQITQTS